MKKELVSGSSGIIPVWQVQDPEFLLPKIQENPN
jgi:hypothetical protein